MEETLVVFILYIVRLLVVHTKLGDVDETSLILSNSFFGKNKVTWKHNYYISMTFSHIKFNIIFT